MRPDPPAPNMPNTGRTGKYALRETPEPPVQVVEVAVEKVVEVPVRAKGLESRAAMVGAGAATVVLVLLERLF